MNRENGLKFRVGGVVTGRVAGSWCHVCGLFIE
jgi:hypothetical protein